MDVHWEIVTMQDFHSYYDNQEMDINGQLDLKFVINATQEVAASLSLTDVDAGISLLISHMNLTIQLGRINAGKVTVLSCAFGTFNALQLKITINNGLRLFTPFINMKLDNKVIQLPTHVLGYFDLVDMTLSYYDDFIYVGITPLFVPPALD